MLHSFFRLLPGHLTALGAGLLVTLSLAPFNYWPLGIVSCALLAWTLRDLTPAQSAWRGWFYGLGLFGAGASWVYVSIHVYGNASVPLALSLMTLFTMGLAALFTVIPFYLYGRFLRNLPLGSTLGFAALLVLAEWLRSWLLTGFPWLYLGYGHLDTMLSGWAPVASVMSISFIIALTGATITQSLCDKRLSQPMAVCCALLWLAGSGLKTIQWTQPSHQPPIKVALIQANIDQAIKWNRDQYQPTLQLYETLSQPHWPETDIIIWPEAAIPGYYRQAKGFLSYMEDIATEHNTTLITGIPTQQNTNSDEKPAYYNSVMAFGSGSGIYHKQRLVPFGEYVPLENLLRGLIDFFDLPMSAFSAGTAKQPLLRAANVTLSPSICYEVVYGDLVSSTTPEADLLLTISNDAWFGDSIGPIQHMEMAQMRALETGRYMIRATSNGISAFVNDKGHIVKRSQQFTREVLVGEVKVMQGATPYALTGSLPIVFLCFIICIGSYFFKGIQI